MITPNVCKPLRTMKTLLRSSFVAALLVGFLCLLTATPALAQTTYTVTTTSDAVGVDNQCSLRDALQKATGIGGGGTCNGTGSGLPFIIEFDIAGGGPHVIQPQTPYVTLDRPIIIDGSTETNNAGVCTTAIPNRPIYQVIIDGSSLSAGDDGFVIDLPAAFASDGITIRGLNIRNFPDRAISIGRGEANVNIACNFIGTDETGQTDQGNGTGIYFSQVGGGGNGSTIGGTTTGAGNLISGNGTGILLSQSQRPLIQGNYIGTKKNGTETLGNSNDGIRFENTRLGTIGGGTAGGENVVAGNGRHGIFLTGGNSFDNIIRDNFIGTDIGASLDLGNAADGIRVEDRSNTIGGTGTNQPNTIAHNGGNGVTVNTLAGDLAVPVRRNRIFSNDGLGIDLGGNGATANDAGDGDDGPNKLQNTPVLTVAGAGGGTMTVSFRVESAPGNQSYPLTVEFFLADSDSEEGMTYLGSTSYTLAEAQTDVLRNISIAAAAMDGDQIVATATDAAGNTSEFSAPVTLGAQGTLVVNSTDDDGDATPGDGVCETATANECTLRAAIQEANAFAGGNEVAFALTGNASGVPYVIQPQTALPTITDPLTINGSTQAGNEGVCTTALASRPTYQVVLDGSALPNGTNGLVFSTGNSAVRGLNVRHFPEAALLFDGDGAAVEDIVVACNFIGTDETGLTAAANGVAVDVNDVGAPGASSATMRIGGTALQDANLISGNQRALRLLNTHWTLIRGNYIGLKKNGTEALGNQFDGIQFDDGSSFNTVGGSTAGAGNVISANRNGVDFNDFSGTQAGRGNVVVGNLIGTAADGTTDMGNRGVGVRIAAAESGQTIGRAGAGNVIAYNEIGVQVGTTATTNITGIVIRENQIFANTALGIDLGNNGVTDNDADTGDDDTGPNKLQNFPVMTAASVAGNSLEVRFIVPSAPANQRYPITVEFFLADGDSEEGMTFLGSTSYTQGQAQTDVLRTIPLSTTVVDGDDLVATATDADGNTSEFSTPFTVGTDCLMVTTDADNGAGSLRAAIDCANLLAGADQITFAIPGDGPHVIQPTSQLPTITEAVTIDGATQTGNAAVCINPIDERVEYQIVLDGSDPAMPSGANGLIVTASYVTVRGLNIRNFGGSGLRFNAPSSGETLDNISVACNFIGTDETGLTAAANGLGLSASGVGTPDGSSPSMVIDGNLISGNARGVRLFGTHQALVQGNVIGLKKNGTEALGNAFEGVQLGDGASFNTIGGTEAGAANVIAANREGVDFTGSATTTTGAGNVIAGNFIGTAADGTTAFGNTEAGIIITATESNQTIGGLGAGNVIAYNGVGVQVSDADITGVVMRDNQIFGNTALGIDLVGGTEDADGVTENDAGDGDADTGPNNLQNYPVLQSVKEIGSVLSFRFRVPTSPSNHAYPLTLDFYVADSDGQEGQTYLGSYSLPEGEAFDQVVRSITPVADVGEGDQIVATATDADGNTSEFSAPVLLGGPCLTVTALGNAGPGTLRDAIVCANIVAGADTIRFNIPGDGPHVLDPTQALPTITDALTIDGSTQPGNEAVCTEAIPDRPAYQVVLDGFRLPDGASGLVANARNVTIRGLNIRNVPDYGLRFISPSDDITDHIIQCNFIGTNETGLEAAGNYYGIGTNTLASPDGSSPSMLIGGTDPEDANLLSGNAFGIYLFNSEHVLVQGNYIGVKKNGTEALGNQFAGIRLDGVGGYNTIGGTAPGAANVISGNGREGIHFRGASFSDNPVGPGNVIAGNLIGVGADGTTALGNKDEGILFTGAESGQTIGGAGAGNIIAHNEVGIYISETNPGFTIQENQIYDNVGLGIDLVGGTEDSDGMTANDTGDADIGPNHLQNYPELAEAIVVGNVLEVRFTVPSAPANQPYPLTVEFFAADSNGQEGQTYLGSITYEEADAQTEVLETLTPLSPVSAGDQVVATATDANGSTSEFSAPVTATSVALDCLTVITTADSGEGSLREAIDCANATPEHDTITFFIPGEGPHAITMANPPLMITAPVTIDGTTQPGNENLCTTAIPDRGTYQVAIGGPFYGFWLRAGSDGSTIRGLNIRDVATGIQSENSSGHTIECNFLGTDETGLVDRATNGLGSGVHLSGGAGHTIGGTDAGLGNLIAGNEEDYGVFLDDGTSEALVQHNFVGTDKTGAAAIANRIGIAVGVQTISDIETDARLLDNLVSGNVSHGIQLRLSSGAVVARNLIGTDTTGTLDVGNGGAGLYAQDLATSTVGGTDTADGNTVAFNGGDGIAIVGDAAQVAVLGNSVFDNTGEGIDLASNGATTNDAGDPDDGPNNLQNTPAVAEAIINGIDLEVTYAVDTAPANATYPLRIEFFLPGSGNEEGHTFVFADTYTEDDYDGCGTAPCEKEVILDDAALTYGTSFYLTATATDADGHTSEFSGAALASVSCTSVTTTADSGTGSLRAAITCANAEAGLDLIKFNIAGAGPHVITPATNLPPITDAVVIDASTQPGNETVCTSPINARGTYAVALDGGGATIDGLTLDAGSDGSAIRGLNIRDFRIGVFFNAGSAGSTVQCSFIGTNEVGTTADGNNAGISFFNSSGHTIGGTAPEDGNLISGNSLGIELVGSSTTGNVVQGNYIGARKTGTTAIPNTTDGIGFFFGASGNTIGGTTEGAGNLIAFNAGVGVNVGPNVTEVSIRGNAFFENTGLGIDLGGDGMTANDDGDGDSDTGANKLQNTPVIVGAATESDILSVSYRVGTSVAHATYPLAVDFYLADAAGEEGLTYLGTLSYAAGDAQTEVMQGLVVTAPVSDGDIIVATATDADGNTSEFSGSATVGALVVGPLVVTTAADVVDGDVSSNAALQTFPGADGAISLREAVSAANNTPGQDEILFDAALDGTPILLDIPDTNESANADGDLDVSDPDGLVITGNGEAATILDGAADGRVLYIRAGDITLTGLTIQNGNARSGAGFYVNTSAGDLILDRVTVADNVSTRFAAGLYFIPTGGTATLTNCAFTNNMALDGSGGGMYINATNGTFIMDNCTIAGNTSTQDGAGIDLAISTGTGTSMISNSLIADNVTQTDGGGLDFNASDTRLTIVNSTFSGNEAVGRGGGISHDASGDGDPTTATLILDFVTITDNTAGTGSGIDFTETNMTPVPGFEITSTIIQGNTGDDCANTGGNPITSGGGNVFGTGCPVTADDTTGPANLGPLADNGGPTFTHALLAGSAALDFATCDGTTTDQRGKPRDAGACDAGAFESDLEGSGLTVAVSLWLEGPWNGSDMDVNLSDVLPEIDPYFSAESVSSDFFTTDANGQNVIDWVWLELRSDETTTVVTTAALLMADGSVKATDATSDVAFMGLSAGSYFLVVGHRTSLAVMSASAVDCSGGTCTYDFRTAMTQAYGTNAMIDLSGGGSGPYALVTGDADRNGQVQASDKNAYFNAQVGQSGYREADFDLNGEVQASDKNAYFTKNVGRGTQVPTAGASAKTVEVAPSPTPKGAISDR